MKSALNRRGLFALLGRPLQQSLTTQRTPTATVERVAVIQGRRCLALTSFCAACVERCPVGGAMHVVNGMPLVIPEACTGCGICQQVCPAPTNAVLLMPRRPTIQTLPNAVVA